MEALLCTYDARKIRPSQPAVFIPVHIASPHATSNTLFISTFFFLLRFFLWIGDLKTMTPPSKRDALRPCMCGEAPAPPHSVSSASLHVLPYTAAAARLRLPGVNRVGAPGLLDSGLGQCSPVGTLRQCFNAGTRPTYCFTNFINHEAH